MKNKKIFTIFILFLSILVLTSCSKNNIESKKQEKNHSFEFLNVFGGVLFDLPGKVFPLKDGTFYVVAETYSPASIRDIPNSCHFKSYGLFNMSDCIEDYGDVWIFQIDPKKEEGKQVIYSRCFGGSKGDGVASATITEDEQIVICSISNSNDGDLKSYREGDKKWIFRVDPKKEWKKQITFSMAFHGSEFDYVNDIKFVSKDIAYLYISKKNSDGCMYSLLGLDFSKEPSYNSEFFRRDIFFTDMKLIRDGSIYTKNKIVFSDDGIATLVVAIDKDHIFMPNDIKKELNIQKKISYKDDKKSKDDENIKSGRYSDVLVLSLDTKRSESDWIVFSRFIGGNNCDFLPSILKSKEGKYWIAFLSSSCDGELEGVKIKGENANYNNLVLLRLNTKLAFDKQIEYLKYLSTPKDECWGLYCFDVDKNDNIAFLSQKNKRNSNKNSSNEKDKDIIVENNKYDKNKNIVFPSIGDKNYNKTYEMFYIDTNKNETFSKDLYINTDACYALKFYNDSSLIFCMSTNSLPNFGDMPSYEISFIEKQINNMLDRKDGENSSLNILVGILPIKNMKKID